MTQTTHSGGTLRSGLLVGLLLAVFTGLITALYDLGVLPGVVQCAEFLIALAAFFIAGMLAARATGRIVSGLLAGLIASVFAALVILGANILMAIVSPQQFATAFGWHDLTSSQLVTAAIGQSLVGLLLWGVCGLILGVLGGLLGRRGAAQVGSTFVSQ
jgi:hypothetical protein